MLAIVKHDFPQHGYCDNHVTTLTQITWQLSLNVTGSDHWMTCTTYVTTSGILQGSLAPCAPRACVGPVTWTWTTHAENCTWQLRIPDREVERWLQGDWEDILLIFITKSYNTRILTSDKNANFVKLPSQYPLSPLTMKTKDAITLERRRLVQDFKSLYPSPHHIVSLLFAGESWCSPYVSSPMFCFRGPRQKNSHQLSLLC